MRCTLLVIVACLTNTVTRTAFADEPTSPSSMTDSQNLYLRLSLGGGYGIGSYKTRSFRSSGDVKFPVSHGLTIESVDLATLHVAIGARRGALAYGAEASGGVSKLSQDGSFSDPYFLFAAPLSLGGFVDYYPDARGPIHLQGGIGAALTWLAGARNKCSMCGDATDNAPSDLPSGLFGAKAYVGAGYDLGAESTGGFGLFLRTHFAYLAGSETTYLPLGAELGISGAWL